MTEQRAAVSRSTVVEAALALLAEGGLEAVSFRRIAARLGVSGPTLYWHVDNKRQLMDLMAEELVRRGRTETGPTAGQSVWDWLREDSLRMFAALAATRDAPRVVAGNRPTVEAFDGIERSLRVLVEAGLTPGEAQQTFFALGAYVIGSATEWQAESEREGSAPPAPDAARADAFASLPLITAAVHEMRAQPHAATFEFGLDLLLDGLRARYAR